MGGAGHYDHAVSESFYLELSRNNDMKCFVFIIKIAILKSHFPLNV